MSTKTEKSTAFSVTKTTRQYLIQNEGQTIEGIRTWAPLTKYSDPDLVSHNGGEPGSIEEILVTSEYEARSPIWTATLTVNSDGWNIFSRQFEIFCLTLVYGSVIYQALKFSGIELWLVQQNFFLEGVGAIFSDFFPNTSLSTCCSCLT